VLTADTADRKQVELQKIY